MGNALGSMGITLTGVQRFGEDPFRLLERMLYPREEL